MNSHIEIYLIIKKIELGLILFNWFRGIMVCKLNKLH